MLIACVIPARLKSTRFPRKMLAPLLGKPLIQWVWEAASRVSLFSELAIATDSEELAAIARGFGAKCYMTSEECATGSDRLIELRKRGSIKADIWVNWQGDEPFINARTLTDLLQSCGEDGADVWTLKKKITQEEALTPHVCKVVTNSEGFALYFSRHPIPFVRDIKPQSSIEFFKHIGMYAYSDAALLKLSSLKPCPLEEAEQLEQLRFLYNSLSVRVHETQEEPFGIDLPEHLALAHKKAQELTRC
ncbi:MAG: 3-deoxy-manno-octulosonate cytidylyltransferase [Chlamydiales bacterium]|nr:3-deoxy-manno-octulosonate cytidylyltransferase [Chlamydiales bacterium]